MERLAKKFNDSILPELQKELGIKNINAVPRVLKVVITSGTGAFKEDKKTIEKIAEELATITGQKMKINLSRKASTNPLLK
jgi:large subunit ribosomal protein L5